jgi:hypothetical protein
MPHRSASEPPSADTDRVRAGFDGIARVAEEAGSASSEVLGAYEAYLLRHVPQDARRRWRSAAARASSRGAWPSARTGWMRWTFRRR